MAAITVSIKMHSPMHASEREQSMSAQTTLRTNRNRNYAYANKKRAQSEQKTQRDSATRHKRKQLRIMKSKWAFVNYSKVKCSNQNKITHFYMCNDRELWDARTWRCVKFMANACVLFGREHLRFFGRMCISLWHVVAAEQPPLLCIGFMYWPKSVI